MNFRRRAAARLLAITAACAATIVLGAPQAAQAGYPDKPIRVIVPFPPGGGGDTLARLVLTKIAEQQGWSVIVDNRAGAGGNIGTASAAHAAPDGYTLAYGTNGTHAINQTLYKNPGFDPVKDFEPISRFTQIALLLVTNPEKIPAKNAKDLIAYLKANPGKINVASAGNGTTSHLAQEMFKAATGVQYQHVPYRGGGPAKIDLLSGQVQMMIEIMPSVFPMVKAGKLNGLAVTTAKRWPLAPDVPTLNEAAVPGFVVTAWDGLWAPKGTPKEVVDIWNAAARKALADPALRDKLLASGAEPSPTSPSELGAFVKSEIPRWGKAVEQSGAKVD
ncbi:MAG: Bug family tripartite tricarboxylate transporter substrate binding protein [Pseudolabrys sp.]